MVKESSNFTIFGEEINEGLASMDSMESRWVFLDEDDSEIEDDYDKDNDASQRTANTAAALDSEDEDDNAEQSLVCTGPRIDSFDVKALEVPGAVRNEYEVEERVRKKGRDFHKSKTGSILAFKVSFREQFA